MLNNEKSILIAYLDISQFNKVKAMEYLNQFKGYIERSFYNEKEINDDSLVILTIPTNRTEIVLLNSKYPDYEQVKKDAEQILENFINEKINS